MAAGAVAGDFTTTRANEISMSKSLAKAAARKGRYFGAAARFDQLRSVPALRKAMLRDCSCLTPEIHTNWDQVEREPGQRDFSPADALVAFAGKHGMMVRGHSLLWDQSTPDWAKAHLLATRDWSLIESHFDALLSRYEGAIQEWDVVNEAIDTEGGVEGLRTTTFFRAFGADYIPRAFATARQRAPTARLVLNEYGLEYDNVEENARRTRYLKLLEQLKVAGAPVDVAGIQAHLDLSKGPLKARLLRPFFREIADLGYEIAITELDVKEHDFALPVAWRDQRASDHVQAYLDIALDEPAIKGVTTWGLGDRFSWLDGATPGPDREPGPGLNRGLPYDDRLRPKPMHGALHDAFSNQGAT
jgi:endo-1,4-beta-xylanase